MFYGWSSLQSIDLSSFNTTNVNDMRRMFSECSSLQSIDLSSFNTTNVNDMKGMFLGCSSLKKENVRIYCVEFIRNYSKYSENCHYYNNSENKILNEL